MGVGTSAGLMYVGAPVILDDAQLYIAAVESTGYVMPQTEKDAVTAYVAALKANGTWTKKRAVYLFSGNTAASQKWNLKDPRDLDAAYRLTFSGTPTHSASGCKFDAASSSFANSHLTDTLLGLESIHMGCMVFNVTASGAVGQIGTVNAQNIYVQALLTDGISLATSYSTYQILPVASGEGSTALDFDGASFRTIKDGVVIDTLSRTTLAPGNFAFYIGALNQANTVNGPVNDLFTFAELGKSQTSAEITADYNALVTYLMAIGRLAVHTDTKTAVNWVFGAGGTVGITPISVLDRLVRDLHGEVNGSYSTSDIWAKFTAIYPMPGASAASHSLNLKAPGTFTLTYDAGITHSASGIHVIPAAVVHTGIIPQTHLSRINKHLSVHQSAIVDATGGVVPIVADLGIGSYDAVSYVQGGQLWNLLSSVVSSGISLGGASSIKSYFSMSRMSEGTIDHRYSGFTQAESKAADPGSQNTAEISLNHTTAGIGRAFTFDWATIGAGLTPAELVTLEQYWSAYQTGMRRSTATAIAVALFVVLALLFSLGITLTQQQIEELNNILLGLPPAPVPAAASSKKSKKKFSKKDIPSEALEYIRSLGHKI